MVSVSRINFTSYFFLRGRRLRRVQHVTEEKLCRFFSLSYKNLLQEEQYQIIRWCRQIKASLSTFFRRWDALLQTTNEYNNRRIRYTGRWDSIRKVELIIWLVIFYLRGGSTQSQIRIHQKMSLKKLYNCGRI